MAVNEAYFGEKATWQVAHAKSENQNFAVKIATFNTANTTECLSGAFTYKYGALYDESEDYIVDVDNTFCYCAMDVNAPMLSVIFATAPITSGDNAGHFYAKMTVSPDKPVPFGWSMGTVRDYVTVLGTADTWRYAPVNYKPDWYNTSWHPQSGSYSGKTAVSYLSELPVDYTLAPVLSYQYKNVKLVPVIRAYSLASGKTEDDVKNAVTLSEFYACVSSSVTVDLKTYVSDTYDGIPFYQKFPVISSVYAAAVLLYFDQNGDLDTPPGSLAKYHSTAESTSSWSSLRSAFNPVYFHEQTDFDEMYKYDGTSYAAGTEFSCEAMMFPASRAPFAYVNYAYNGGTSPTKALSIDSNGWGAFCVAGRAAASGNIRTDMYPRVIDFANFRTFWDSSSSNCECGNVVSDYTDITGFQEYVRGLIAYFGMYFSDGVENDVEEKSTMDTVGLHLGIIDEDGITHGQYTTGTQNRTAPNYDWEDPVDDTPWTPGGGGGDDTEDPSDPYTPYPQPENGFGVCLKHYAIRRGDLQDLIDWIYYYTSYDHALDAATQAGTQADFNAKYPDPAAWVAHVCERAGYNVFPTNDIVGVMAFPFDLSGSDAGYMLGHWDTSIYHDYFHELADAPLLTGKLLTTGHKLLNMGSYDIHGRFGDYRDYPPYSRIELQVPYHGTVDLDPADWIGKTVAVSIIVDLLTGSSLAIVSRVSGGVSTPVITMPGQMGISVPITADNAGQTANTFAAMSTAYQTGRVSFAAGIAGDVISAVQGTAGAVLSAATLDAGGVISSAPNVPRALVSGISSALNYGRDAAQQVYEMQHIASGKMVMGTGSPSTSFAYEYRCRIVYHYPTILANAGVDSFAGVLGHACNSSGRIGDFSGFTKFGAVDLSGIPCTADEQQIILDLLQNGIFL